MSTYILNITNGVIAFYEKPAAGGTLDLSAGALCVCAQVSNINIAATANTTDVPATFCSPAGTRNVASSFTLNVEGIQDWGRDDGDESFSEFLFAHDSGQVIAVVLPAEGGEVKAVAEVSIAAGDFLGPAGETLTFTGAFPVTGYPDIYDNTGAVIRKGAAGSTPETADIAITGEVDCTGAAPLATTSSASQAPAE